MKKSAIIFLHAGYWLLYLALVLSFLMAIANNKADQSLAKMGKMVLFSPMSIVTLLPAVTGFYSFYTFLFTRFLNRRRLLAFFVWAIITVLFCGLITVFVLSIYVPVTFSISNFSPLLAVSVFLSMLALINGIIGLVMRGFITWYGDIRVKEELKRKNYEVELALIKSQINPHFLFNTINNIDVLIEKDPAKASAYLNKLSDIMRFMLYETKSEKVLLARELTYIEKYVELQRIRTSNPYYIRYEVKGEAGSKMIEPMLFIPFIENAFKHAEYKKNEDAIHIEFDVSQEKIHFRCNNRYIKSIQAKPDHSGLGNELIRKRLDLLYAQKYELDIKEEDGFYKVSLMLHIHEN